SSRKLPPFAAVRFKVAVAIGFSFVRLVLSVFGEDQQYPLRLDSTPQFQTLANFPDMYLCSFFSSLGPCAPPADLSSPLSAMPAKKAIDQKSQHNRRHHHICPVPLPQERQKREHHPRNRRRNQHQQTQLNQPA